jgi:hypothetical protein
VSDPDLTPKLCAELVFGSGHIERGYVTRDQLAVFAKSIRRAMLDEQKRARARAAGDVKEPGDCPACQKEKP